MGASVSLAAGFAYIGAETHRAYTIQGSLCENRITAAAYIFYNLPRALPLHRQRSFLSPVLSLLDPISTSSSAFSWTYVLGLYAFLCDSLLHTVRSISSVAGSAFAVRQPRCQWCAVRIVGSALGWKEEHQPVWLTLHRLCLWRHTAKERRRDGNPACVAISSVGTWSACGSGTV